MENELVNKYSKLVHKIHRQRKSRKGHVEHMILMHIDDYSCTPHDLVVEFDITPQMVSGFINILEEKNYIYRSVDKKDKRKFILSITEQGKQYVKQLKDEHFKEVFDMLNHIGLEDVESLIRIYEKILKYYQEDKK